MGGQNMNKVGIYFAYWSKDWTADFIYYLNKVADLGFDVLEVTAEHILNMSDNKLKNLKSAAIERDINLTYAIGFSPNYDIASEDNNVRKKGIEYAKRILDSIYRMNGKILCGITYSSWPLVVNKDIFDKRAWLDRSIKGVKEIIKTAEDFGIYYCLEVVNRFEQFLLNTVEEGIEFCKAVNSSNIKLHLDTFHMNIEEDNISDSIIKAGGYIGHMHIGENNRNVPGKGHMPWDEIFNALIEISYKGYIVMEPFVKMGGEVGRDIRVWRNLLNNCDEECLDNYAKSALEFIRCKLKNKK
jgi:D-psicose/D-tagatose/L-ribulose 3-epimerase